MGRCDADTNCRGQALRRGFTLVEIMFVMLIIGVLLAVAVPAYRHIRAQSRIEEARGRIEMLAAAVRQLAWDTGKWPGGIARNIAGDSETWDLTTPRAGLLACDPSRFTEWKGPYIPAIPLDPWGSPYFFDPDYRIAGQDRCVVGSFGPNRNGRNVYDSDNVYIILK